MLAVEIKSTADLVPGIWGIPEPALSPGPYELPALDLALVPCVGASPNGARLGHGAGYYDRFFENCETYKLCLCFADLLTDEIPMLPHDTPMDGVITENTLP
jgi:5-formyltetrahydrofolate cyclo-ligase